MGYYIVVGVRMDEDEFEEHFGNPSESELLGRLVAIDGGEDDIDDVVIGQVIQKMDKYMEGSGSHGFVGTQHHGWQ